MNVRVYYNLHKHCLSVQAQTPKGWRVIHHCLGLHLHDPKFVVSEAGRQRVIKRRRKNVHAYVTGFLNLKKPAYFKEENACRVSYNPYKGAAFFNPANGENIYNASGCSIQGKTITAYSPNLHPKDA
jgi:hypothetical protein